MLRRQVQRLSALHRALLQRGPSFQQERQAVHRARLRGHVHRRLALPGAAGVQRQQEQGLQRLHVARGLQEI